MGELIAEALLAIVRVFVELVLQSPFEVAAEVGLRATRAPFRRPEPTHRLLAALGYAILGCVCGVASLWIAAPSVREAESLRVVSLVGEPVLAGLVMCALGVWRRRRGDALIRLDRFSYGYLFALCMAGVRFMATQP